MQRPHGAAQHGAAIPNHMMRAMYPAQPVHWQILTFLAFAVPFCVCLYKFDVNIAFGVFFITYFVMSLFASFRAAQITRRFRVNETEFLRGIQQQLQANPNARQDHNAALHLYLAMMDRDFTDTGTCAAILPKRLCAHFTSFQFIIAPRFFLQFLLLTQYLSYPLVPSRLRAAFDTGRSDGEAWWCLHRSIEDFRRRDVWRYDC